MKHRRRQGMNQAQVKALLLMLQALDNKRNMC